MARRICLGLLLVLPFGCARGIAPDTKEDAAVTDGKLADKTFDKLLKHYGEKANPSQMPDAHRTVFLVYHVHGLIGNGGFQYLFEGDLPGDPELIRTQQAFKTIRAQKAVDAFAKALAVFPNSTPPKDIQRRLKIYQSKYTLMDAIDNKQSPDAIYIDAMKETMQKLDSYIQDNQASFDTLR